MGRHKADVVYGVGINDCDYPRPNDCPFYVKWRSMIRRCYSSYEIHKSYSDCSVCDEWLLFSSFREWMSNQDWEGKELDKDILILDNKKYSPESCVFVDPILNRIFQRHIVSDCSLPRGVQKQKDRYVARDYFNYQRIHLGMFNDPMKAHQAWQRSKIRTILNIAETQNDPIRSALIFRANRIQEHINAGIETIQV